MRILPERPDHDGESSAGQKSASDGHPDPRVHGKNPVPLHDVLPRPTCDQACREGHSQSRLQLQQGGGSVNTKIPKHIEDALENLNVSTSRRTFLKSSGLLVVSFSAAPLVAAAGEQAVVQQAAGPYPDPDFHQLDSWIVIHEDNTATFYVGKTDMGQGTGTAFRQLMADELDMPFEKTACVMGITDMTVDQGGSGGSNAIQTSAWPMRRVAA